MGFSQKGILSAIACLFFNIALSVFVASVVYNKICYIKFDDEETSLEYHAKQHEVNITNISEYHLENVTTFWLVQYQDHSRLSVFSVITSILFYFIGNKM